MTRDRQKETAERVADLQRQITSLDGPSDRLLNLRLLEEIDQETFASKSTEIRDRVVKLTLQIEAQRRTKDENADVAVNAFELSQALREKWLTADVPEKRQLLEIVCLNLTLNDATLVPTWRKPFDMLAEGLLSEDSRDDTRCTLVDEFEPRHLAGMLLGTAIPFGPADIAKIRS